MHVNARLGIMISAFKLCQGDLRVPGPASLCGSVTAGWLSHVTAPRRSLSRVIDGLPAAGEWSCQWVTVRVLFGMLWIDPETVLDPMPTTRMPGRFYRTGTVVGPCWWWLGLARVCGHVHSKDWKSRNKITSSSADWSRLSWGYRIVTHIA